MKRKEAKKEAETTEKAQSDAEILLFISLRPSVTAR